MDYLILHCLEVIGEWVMTYKSFNIMKELLIYISMMSDDILFYTSFFFFFFFIIILH